MKDAVHCNCDRPIPDRQGHCITCNGSVLSPQGFVVDRHNLTACQPSPVGVEVNGGTIYELEATHGGHPQWGPLDGTARLSPPCLETEGEPRELTNAQQKAIIDWKWKTEQPLLRRVVYRLFHITIKRMIGAVLSHAYERSIINSEQLHKMDDIAYYVTRPQKPHL